MSSACSGLFGEDDVFDGQNPNAAGFEEDATLDAPDLNTSLDSFPGRGPTPGHHWASVPVPARDQTQFVLGIQLQVLLRIKLMFPPRIQILVLFRS